MSRFQQLLLRGGTRPGFDPGLADPRFPPDIADTAAPPDGGSELLKAFVNERLPGMGARPAGGGLAAGRPLTQEEAALAELPVHPAELPRRPGPFAGPFADPPPSPQPAASPLAAALAPPAGSFTRTFTGYSPTQGLTRTEYDIAGDRVAGGRRNGQAFDGTPEGLAKLDFADALGQGQRETGVQGVPSQGFLAQALGRAGLGGSPMLDQQRLAVAQDQQLKLADINGRVQAAGLRKSPQDRLTDMADAVFAQTLQRTQNGAQAQLERERFLANAAQSNQDLAGLGIGRGARPGLAAPAGGLQQQAADYDASASIVNALRGAAVAPDGKPRDFTTDDLRAALAGVDPAQLGRPGVTGQVVQALLGGDKALSAPKLTEELARLAAQNYVTRNTNGPAYRNAVPAPQVPGTDLRLENLGTRLAQLGDRVTGGSGYGYVRLPDGRLVPLGPTGGSFSAATRNPADAAKLDQQQQLAASLLRELLKAQQGGVR